MFNYKSIARVSKNGRRGTMFGTILQVPEPVAEVYGFKFILIYGNACYYCKAEDEFLAKCAKHNWGVVFYESEGER